MRQFLELPLTPPDACAWPLWLDNCRIADEALAEAYDHVSMPQRAGIKQCMAFCQSVYGTAPEQRITASADSGQGFWRSQRSAPAPWTLVIITPDYDAPARLTAAILPAVLARVPRTALLCIGGMPQESARAVLELTGLEDSFITSTAQAERLIRELHTAPADADNPADCAAAGSADRATAGPTIRENLGLAARADTGPAIYANSGPVVQAASGAGRLLLLHKGTLAPLRALAAELGIPCMEEATAPRIGLLCPAATRRGSAALSTVDTSGHTTKQTAGNSTSSIAERTPVRTITTADMTVQAGAELAAADMAEATPLDLEQLAFAHGTASAQALYIASANTDSSAATVSSAATATAPLDACLAEESQLAAASRVARLALAPGMEACWLHAALTREFFRNTSMTAGICLPETDFFSGGPHEGAD